MDDLNISHMSNAYARELSGGQKKLLELARSIINEPEILLLDEPLAGVNPKLADTHGAILVEKNKMQKMLIASDALAV